MCDTSPSYRQQITTLSSTHPLEITATWLIVTHSKKGTATAVCRSNACSKTKERSTYICASNIRMSLHSQLRNNIGATASATRSCRKPCADIRRRSIRPKISTPHSVRICTRNHSLKDKPRGWFHLQRGQNSTIELGPLHNTANIVSEVGFMEDADNKSIQPTS